MADETFYEVLEVDPSALLTEIKGNFRRLAFFHHPDKVKHLGEAAQESADKKMREVTEAFAVLKSPEKRKIYDKCLKDGLDFSIEYSRSQSETDEDRQKRKEKLERKKHMLSAAGRTVVENIKAININTKWTISDSDDYFNFVMTSTTSGNHCHVHIKTVDQLLPEALDNIIEFANETSPVTKSLLIKEHFSFVIIAARLKQGVEIREAIKKYNSSLLNAGRGDVRRGIVLIKIKRPEPFVPYSNNLKPEFATMKLKLI